MNVFKKPIILVSLLSSFIQSSTINIDSLTLQADGGDKYAKVILGELYRIGEKGVKQDFDKAISLFKETESHPLSVFNLAFMYESGTGLEKDSTKAEKFYLKFISKAQAEIFISLPEVQTKLGYCYLNSKGVERDLNKAIEWYTKAAEQGHISAQLELGFLYGLKISGIERDLKKSNEWYTKAAEQGDASAQIILGDFYQYGTNEIEKNLKIAREWYTKAAEQEDASAQIELGNFYKYGKGIEKDLNKAKEWFTKAKERYIEAAEQGDAVSQIELGDYYLYGSFQKFGTGAERDLNKAKEWYTKAAEKGNTKAQLKLGAYYEGGEGGEKDLTKAVFWYKEAAKTGNKTAQLHVTRLTFCSRLNAVLKNNNNTVTSTGKELIVNGVIIAEGNYCCGTMSNVSASLVRKKYGCK